MSAGTEPVGAVNPNAVAVMAERGIDLGSHFPKTFVSIPRPIELVVAVCSQAADNCPYPGANVAVERWDLPDPAAAVGSAEEVLAVFRASRDEIERRVRDLVARL